MRTAGLLAGGKVHIALCRRIALTFLAREGRRARGEGCFWHKAEDFGVFSSRFPFPKDGCQCDKKDEKSNDQTALEKCNVVVL